MAISSYGKTTPTTLGFYTESFPDTSITKTGLEIEPGVYQYVSNVATDLARIQVENNDVRALSSATGTLVITTRGTSITATDLNQGMFVNLSYATVQPSTSGFGAIGIAHNGTIFVAINVLGEIHTSTDGITWTSRTNPYGLTAFRSVASGGGGFVAIRNSLDPAALSSTDGITWSTRTTTIAIGDAPQFVSYANDRFFVGSGVNNTLASSTDGVTFTTLTARNNGTIQKVVYGAGIYRTICNSTIDSTSTDGVTWTTRTSVNSSVRDIIFADNKFIAVGGSASGVIWTSTDGITFTTRANLGAAGLSFISYNADKQLFVGYGNSAVVVSTDAITWTSRSVSGLGTVSSGGGYGTTIPIVNNTYWIPTNSGGYRVTSLSDTSYQSTPGAAPIKFGLALTPTNSSILT